jgi:malonyl-CoA O-methyltransferase
MTEYLRPDKAKVATSFGNAAQHYDAVAVLQRMTGDALIKRLSKAQPAAQRVIDLGVGTGYNLPALSQLFPAAQLIAVDIALPMLKQAKQSHQQLNEVRYLLGDAEQLPVQDNSVDLVFANLALQWCDPRSSFAEISRVLKPGGSVWFTSLGPDSLNELRQAWAAVDDYPHINQFYSVDAVQQAIQQAGFVQLDLHSEPHSLFYDSAMAMMRDLKVLGARNMNQGRRRGLTGKQLLQQVSSNYEMMRLAEGLPASYQVIYGSAQLNSVSEEPA